MQKQYLERFYPTDDGGITKEARRRHFSRYETIIEMLSDAVHGESMVIDAGCGAGYGTEMLQVAFPYVIGVEPNEAALAYAKERYPHCRFTDLPLVGEVVVFCESLEHMTPCEAMSFIGRETRTILVTTPLIEQNRNDYHVNSFSDTDDVFARAKAMGFPKCPRWALWCHQTFTCGSTGEQFLALFTR